MDKSYSTDNIYSSSVRTIGYLLIFCGALIKSISASETNIIYLPLNSKANIGDKAGLIVTTEQLERAKNSDESRPAELDPNGDWGEVVSGFQMSIRFPTNVFFAGDPIGTTVLLRNTTTNSITLPSPQDAAIRLVVKDGRGNILPNLTKKITISGPSSLRLPSHRQIKFSFNLGKMFSLTNSGIYYISAQKVLAAGSGKPPVEVSSAQATIKIVEKP